MIARLVPRWSAWAIEASQVLFRFLYGGQFSGPVLIIVCDEFLGGGVAEGFMETGIVPPVNPVHGGELDLGQGFPGLRIDKLGLVPAVDCLDQGVIITIAHCSGRRLDSVISEFLTVFNARVLRAMIGMVNKTSDIFSIHDCMLKGF